MVILLNILMLLQDKMKRKFAAAEGDHVTLVNVFRAFVKVSFSWEVSTDPFFAFCPGQPIMFAKN